MARVAISEFAAKKLVFADSYVGFTATPTDIDEVAATLPPGNYIVKVDVGIKKRGKQGLIRLNVTAAAVAAAVKELFALGHERCLIEPMVPHETSSERYLSLELVRDGLQVLHVKQGGVEVETAAESERQKYLISRSEVLAGTTSLSLPDVPLSELVAEMNRWHFSFLEINPYIATDTGFIALDMAVEIDSTKESSLPDWVALHVFHKKAASPAEAAVLEQDARTQAALNLHTLNPNGSILTLFSGGGASLVALDSLVAAGLQSEVINYSEYSGAPTRDETATYVTTLLGVLFASKADKKVVLIAGGVANFTDILATFEGIVDAFSAQIEQLKAQNVYVCVRRGGPNQENGLNHLRSFLVKHNIPHDVHDPSLSLGAVGELVKKYL